MAGKGSCCAIAILHTLAGLDLEALCKQQSLAGVNWEAVRRWASFWNKKDPNCKAFRNHVFEVLWKNNQLFQGHFRNDLRRGTDGDVTKRIFNEVLKLACVMASDRGFVVPATTELMDRVQMWAVAILHPKVQLAEELVHALLALELDDKI